MAGEQCILTIEDQRPDSAFDDVGVDLDAAVIEEARKAFPMVLGLN